MEDELAEFCKTEEFEVLRTSRSEFESPGDEEKYREVAMDTADLAAQEIAQLQRSIAELEALLTGREQDNGGRMPGENDVRPAGGAVTVYDDGSIQDDGSNKEDVIFPALPKVVLVMADEPAKTPYKKITCLNGGGDDGEEG